MGLKAAKVEGEMDEATRWVEQSDASTGWVYYWNWSTGESRWEKPHELLLADEVRTNWGAVQRARDEGRFSRARVQGGERKKGQRRGQGQGEGQG
jgi:hypothetical protein